MVLRLVNGPTVSIGWALLHRLLRPLCPAPRLVTQPTYPLREVAVRFRRSSHNNLPVDLGPLQILLHLDEPGLRLIRALHEARAALTTRNQKHKSRGSL